MAGAAALPVLIDQEGGRVMRLRPPHWRGLPSAAEIGRLAAVDPRGRRAKRPGCSGRLIAHDLREVGIDVDCAPVLDVATRRHDRGDRQPLLRGRSRRWWPSSARACADGLLAGGVAPVIKHLPGHGRAVVDSHLALPVVEAAAGRAARQRFRAGRGACAICRSR